MIDHVIVLKARDEFLFERVCKLPQEVMEGTHWDNENMTRRINEYKKNNSTGKGVEYLC